MSKKTIEKTTIWTKTNKKGKTTEVKKTTFWTKKSRKK